LLAASQIARTRSIRLGTSASTQSLSKQSRAEAVAEEPRCVEHIEDAYLAFSASAHFGRWPTETGLDREARCFLEEPFFAGGLDLVEAILIVESPAAFRRRIFITADGLSRPGRRSSKDDPVAVGPAVE
jgi:hypothetical protein